MKSRSACVVVIATLAVAGCKEELPPLSETATPAPVAEVKPPPPQPQPQWKIIKGSDQVAGTVLRTLPNATHTPDSPYGLCADYVMDPETKAGKHVEQRGWFVNHEVVKNGLTYVSFFSEATGGTSGNCDIHDGNVAVFEGGVLIADIYAAKNSGQPLGTIIGRNDVRLIGSSVVGTPIADVVGDRRTKTITISDIPDVELVCDGRLKLPNIYDFNVDQARRKLAAFGWQPRDMSEEGSDSGYMQSLWEAGYVEYAECSGTGFGFCNLEYQRGDARLTVTAYGEEGQTVSDFRVECAE